MNRFLSLLASAVVCAATAQAQPPAKTVTGVMIVRIKVNPPAAEMAVLPPGGEAVGGVPPMMPPPGDLRSVVAAIPFKNLYQGVVYAGKPLIPQTNPSVFWLSSDFGRTLLFTDASRIQLTPQYDINTDVILKAKYTAWAAKRNAEGLFDLVSLALGYDQVETALAYAKELERIIETRKDAPKQIADFVAAFKELTAKFDATLPVAPEASEWKKRLQAVDIAEDKHYSIIHFGNQSVQTEALNTKLAEMERNYKAFFLWHAVMGQRVPTPEKKQIVILAKRSADVPGLRAQLDGSPIVDDGLYVANYNIVVLSPERLDDTGRSFSEMMKAEYDTGWNRESLLKGPPPKVTEKITFGEIFRMSTNALVERAMEVESIRGTVTRECNRQLFVSAGIVPQYVSLPRWLDQGLANLLAKPKNPGVVPGDTPDKPLMVYGYASGYGSPNYLMFREWKQLKLRQEIPIGKPAALQSDANMAQAAKTLLLAVLNDTYFDAVRTNIDPDAPGNEQTIPGTTPPPAGGGFAPPPMQMGLGLPGRGRTEIQARGNPPPPPAPGGGFVPPPPPPPGGMPPMGGPPGMGENPGIIPTMKAKLEAKAQATAWALTYFLSRERPEGMKKYYAELNKLPRDLRIDKKLALQTFARSFSLMNPEQTEIDDVALKDLAKKWIGFLEATQETWRDIPVEATPNPVGPMNNGPIPGPIPGVTG